MTFHTWILLVQASLGYLHIFYVYSVLKKNINTSQSHQAILVDCHNTFQFLGCEDIMLPSVIYFILRMKTDNGEKKTLANQWPECSVNAESWKYNCSRFVQHVVYNLTHSVVKSYFHKAHIFLPYLAWHI